MKVIIDTVDLRKYDDEMNKVLDILIKDLIKLTRERKIKYKMDDDITLSHFKFLLLKASIILSQNLERKVLTIIDEGDNKMIAKMFEKFENKP